MNKQHLDCVKVLLQHKANVNIQVSFSLRPKLKVFGCHSIPTQVFYSIPNVTGQTLSPIYLHKVDFAYLIVYNQSMTTASESQLFGSVVRALVLYRGNPRSIPSEGTGYFTAMLYFVRAIMS